MAHTPGPWKLRQDGSVIQAIETMDGVLICRPYCSNVLPPHGAPDEQQAKGNARLIAVAPELLEALVYLVEAIESSMYGEGGLHTWQCAAPDHGKCSCDARPAMDVALAAIAKAKGDST